MKRWIAKRKIERHAMKSRVLRSEYLEVRSLLSVSGHLDRGTTSPLADIPSDAGDRVPLSLANYGPTANAQQLYTKLNATKVIVLSGNDLEQMPLTYRIVNSVTHGTLTGTAPNLTYTPAAGYLGGDGFTFVVDDGTFESAPATIAISVITATPPKVKPVTVTDLGGLPVGATTMQLSFSKLVVGANQVSSYTLQAAGPDDLLGTPDDVPQSVTSATVVGTVVTLKFPPLSGSLYRLTALSSITDQAGAALDGNGDGVAGDYAQFDFAVTTTAGLDPTFHDAGKLVSDSSGRANELFGQVNTLTLQPDGKIIVAGNVGGDPHYTDIDLARYNPDGSLDVTFNGTGRVKTRILETDTPAKVFVQPDGKLLLVGTTDDDGPIYVAVVRYYSDGSLDPSFDGDGIAKLWLGASIVVGGAALQSDGSVVVAASRMTSAVTEFSIARITPNGALDPTFDGDGVLTTKFSTTNEGAVSVFVQPDGKIIAAGYSRDAAFNYSFVIARYNLNGQLDVTFDGDGKVTTPNMDQLANAVLQPDGKMLVGGGRYLARYNSDGSLDSEFDGDGKFTVPANLPGIASVALQADGKIIYSTGVQLQPAGIANLAAVRLNRDGSIDSAFGSLGIATADMDFSVYAAVRTVAVQADGGIVVAGSTSYYGSKFIVTRFDNVGNWDLGFGNQGFVVVDTLPNNGSVVQDILIQPDGKFLTSGYAVQGTNADSSNVVQRYDVSGTLDSAFDGDGSAWAYMRFRGFANTSIALGPDNKLVVAGYDYADFGVARVNTDGSLDTTFANNNGVVFVDFASKADRALCVAVQNDGKVIAGGYATSNLQKFALARFNADGTLDTSFDGDGKITTDFGTSANQFNQLFIQPDGRILAFGNTAVVRYLPNGQIDTTFGGGIVAVSASKALLQSDGKIVFVGPDRMYRLNGDGTFDNTYQSPAFSQLGLVGRAVDLVSQPDGKIILGFESSANGLEQLSLVRFLPSGALDSTLGAAGRLTVSLGPAAMVTSALALQPNGQLLAAGYVADLVQYQIPYINSSKSILARITLEGNTRLLPSASSTSPFVIDSAGSGAGQLLADSGGAFNGLNRLEVNGTPYAPIVSSSLLADSGSTVVTPIQTIANLNISREVTVSTTGSESFARTLEVLSNPSAQPITTTVRVVGNLGSNAGTTVFSTSDGDAIVEPTDRWIGTDDADNALTPAVIHYVHGPRGLQPTSIAVTGDNIAWTYDVTIPAGQTVRLASFTLLAATRAAATTAANSLVTYSSFSAPAQSFLQSDEVQSLANFGFDQLPVVSPGGPYQVLEGQSLTFNIGISDPDGDALTYQWTRSGMDPQTPLTATLSWEVLKAMQVNDGPATYSLPLVVTDSVGGSVTQIITVTVINAPPILAISGPATVNEGATYTLTKSWSDVGADTLNRWTINWGDGTTQNFSNTAALSHVYTDGAMQYTIMATARDEDGTYSVPGSVLVNVQNVAPTAALSAGGAVREGSPGQVTFTAQNDVSTVDRTAGFKYSYDFNNDGDFDDLFEVSGVTAATQSVPGIYLSDDSHGPYSIHGRISDKDGGFSDYYTTIAVQNVAPAVSLGDTETIVAGLTFMRTFALIDPGSDIWTATIDYDLADGISADPLTLDGKQFTLDHVYTAPGAYSLRVAISDDDGASTSADLTVEVFPSGATYVAARKVYYRGSQFEMTAQQPDSAADAAIASDKRALRPGQTASFANYTGYSRGLNGLMIDIANLPVGTLTAADFAFRVGNNADTSSWLALASQPEVAVRRGVGKDGADRIALTWPDGAIKNHWLQVTLLANQQTGLAAADVFYFGNAVGETGNSALNAQVNSTDEIVARNNPRTFLNRAAIDSVHDFNRDGFVNATDQILARSNSATLATSLQLISVPGAAQAVTTSAETAEPAEGKLLAANAIEIGLTTPVNQQVNLSTYSLREAIPQVHSEPFAGLEFEGELLPLVTHDFAARHFASLDQEASVDEELYERIAADLVESHF